MLRVRRRCSGRARPRPVRFLYVSCQQKQGEKATSPDRISQRHLSSIVEASSERAKEETAFGTAKRRG